jgi:hypothetical protein
MGRKLRPDRRRGRRRERNVVRGEHVQGGERRNFIGFSCAAVVVVVAAVVLLRENHSSS